MKAIKKINNNVAICIDGNGKETIAFGNGIGFPAMPYEVDLAKIDRTFYNISDTYLQLLNDLPADVLEFSAKLVAVASEHLTYTLNPNVVLTLADHIAFALEREKKCLYISMPLAYDMEQLYPMEMKLARYALKKIQEVFHVKLQKNELSGMAMAFVNARVTTDSTREYEHQFETVLEHISEIIEEQLDFKIDKSSFGYARFATHLQYLMARITRHEYIDSDNLVAYQSLKEEYAEVSACVDSIITYMNQALTCEITEEEKMYLILHVNRIHTKEGL